MKKTTEWIEHEDALHKTYTFISFEEAMKFMQQAVPLISELDHHPEWTNIYNRIIVRLTTHDSGSVVTARDHQLAAALDALVSRPA
ncbi:MAG: pterin-4-alpha-carbinolamine dehydratase [Bacteroidetes bacterium]|nr:pterin-4-alpha-carbinolamine dehydratase [Bacteroidota bacterium]